jgi:hypothetical protein
LGYAAESHFFTPRQTNNSSGDKTAIIEEWAQIHHPKAYQQHVATMPGRN